MTEKTGDHIGPDAKAWISRLREINKRSQFTASERGLIEERLSAIQNDLGKPKPFIEGR